MRAKVQRRGKRPRDLPSLARDDPGAFKRMKAMLPQRWRLSAGKHLARVRDTVRIECGAQSLHAIDFVSGEHVREVLAFFHSDSVFASEGAAHLDAHFENFAGEFFRAFERTGNPPIEKNQRMKIAVAGVKNVRATKSRLATHFTNPSQGVAESAPRNDTILHDEVGR